MTNLRAQPDTLDLKLEPKSSKPTRYEKVRYLMRLPSWIKADLHEAAEREGLSLNAWCVRVLAEHAKLSRDGWRSIAEQDEPRLRFHRIAPVDPEPPSGPVSDPFRYTKPPTIKLDGKQFTTGPITFTNDENTGVYQKDTTISSLDITTTGATTSTTEFWTPPPGDIPDLS